MQPVSSFKWQLTVFQRPLFKELANRLESLDLRQSGRRLYFGGNHATDSIKEPTLLGERQIRNYHAEQPDVNAWRLILLAAGR